MTRLRKDLKALYKQSDIKVDRANDFRGLLQDHNDYARIHKRLADQGRVLRQTEVGFVGVDAEDEVIDEADDWRAQWRRIVGG